MMTARTLGGLAVAGVAGWAIGAEGGEVLRKTVDYDHHHPRRSGSPWQKLRALVDHMITDFTFMGRFVVLGGALAAALQTLVPQSSIAGVAHSPLVGSLALMGLAYLLSLCSEADAFVAVFHRLHTDGTARFPSVWSPPRCQAHFPLWGVVP